MSVHNTAGSKVATHEKHQVDIPFHTKMKLYLTRSLTPRNCFMCVQKFGITMVLVLLAFFHFTRGYSQNPEEDYVYRPGRDDYEYEETYSDDGPAFTSNNKPLVPDTKGEVFKEGELPKTGELESSHPFYAIKEEDDGLHFVSSHPTKPAPSLNDNWVEDVDRPYFPKGHDRYFSFAMTEKKIEEMNSRLPHLLENYKNPCWFEEIPKDFTYSKSFFYRYYANALGLLPHSDWKTTFKNMENRIQHRKKQSRDGKGWRLRCYPYYFVLGFTKAGTTDYCRVLHTFPSVFTGIKKEPQYWNKIRTGPITFPDDGKGAMPALADYLDLYDAAAEGIRHKTMMTTNEAYHTGIVGDCDPQTVWQLFNWEHMTGNDDKSQPNYKTPHHLYSLNPKSKFIVLLRDPIERAFSHYKFFHALKKNQESDLDDFHENVNRTIFLLDECTKHKTTRQCIHDRTLVPKFIHTSVTVGLYSIHIREWLNVFPMEQFLFIKSEDYFEKRGNTVRQTIDFLGIDMEDRDLRSVEDISVVNVNTAGHTKMKDKTFRLLKNFYSLYNRDLVNLLQDETFYWGY